MLEIQVIQIGKTKADFIKNAENEYQKRLQGYLKLTTVTLKEKKDLPKSEIINKEAELILESLPKNSFIIVLSEDGKIYDPIKFANLLTSSMQNYSKICFVIGGTYGISEKVKSSANLVLSFSRFTFTHEIIRMLLLEQIYRAFTIINNKKYHY
ncbi:23S rRNA (pseudouridine(1915)-N(3))-methyltransferase RlmH [Candidatus Peregrinibacteria bacterium]|nr:23S rRNA (pseudouridine(1915)-N(3))-methyltransferase RlmH [Candidatus Peregrinibacteria bacterium]